MAVITEVEAKVQIDALRMFLRIAKQMLLVVDVEQLRQECERFNAFGCFFDPSMWIEKREVNQDLQAWLDVIGPRNAKLDSVKLDE